MLEKQIIRWINGDRDYHAGCYLLKHVSPHDPLISLTYTPERQQELFRKLGQALRSGNIPDIAVGEINPPKSSKEDDLGATVKIKVDDSEQKQSSEPPATSHESPAKSYDLPGLTDAQRLAIEAGNHRKERAALHNQLHACRSDKKRKEVVFQIDRLTHEISYKNKVINQLESGELIEVPDIKEIKDKNDYSIPNDLEEMDLFTIDDMIRRYRSTRSKRDNKIQKMAAEGKQSSPAYEQAVADYQQLDTTIKVLDEHKKIRQKSTAAV